MEKIIPFKKDIIFKTNLSEITSISLEHNLSHKDRYLVSGTFTVSGEYKMAEDSVILDSFSYDLPFDINIDDRYNTDKLTIDIDDFYYEIVNDNVLSVSIDVLLANLEEEERETLEDLPEQEIITPVDIEENILKEEEKEKIVEEIIPSSKSIEEEIEKPLEHERCIEEENTLFNNIDTQEEYRSYKVYIVREGDTLEKILESYHISKEELSAYNDLSEIKINDKIIIPAIVDENI